MITVLPAQRPSGWVPIDLWWSWLDELLWTAATEGERVEAAYQLRAASAAMRRRS